MTPEDLTPIPLDEPLEGEEDIQAAKKALRREIKRRIEAMGAEERARASGRVREIVSGLDEYRKARSILFYHALPDEVDLGMLIEETISSGREALLPVTDTAGRKLRIVPVADPVRDLRDGAMGILEPREGLPLGRAEALDLILVPGRAFDSLGGRLGRGGGYYDGFLSQLKPARSGGPFKLGVGFARQLVESVPVQVRDVMLDAVVTEDGVVERESA